MDRGFASGSFWFKQNCRTSAIVFNDLNGVMRYDCILVHFEVLK